MLKLMKRLKEKKGLQMLNVIIVSAILVGAFGLFASMLSKNWDAAEEYSTSQLEQTSNNTKKSASAD